LELSIKLFLKEMEGLVAFMDFGGNQINLRSRHSSVLPFNLQKVQLGRKCVKTFINVKSLESTNYRTPLFLS
jgi:hypothetical protein